ncbi:hypothetical protein LU631_00420 [Erwinia tracheiphila]|uniref:Uncharacterized protein n=2 Tax=Erwinia tracheiphila TaxID=65700 RepID=A0A0M2KH73_9GAMM|nr:hypothetical protein [Erwinia tracheiphila]AXF77664.1 hypothetical protein AV903_19065 [Erwinia tracheiphila]KKF36677.1 hypothetical protein SY86_16520 [Erwinia tracheiphila]UIA83648.1 hypothetical protein LU604_00295 [Erwinia tracheiphila]UIA88014.1 hypothetical protein LU631_00420 [Erwinia tracheiphila]UIA92230.1 hypothetical protein LU632_00290 [Erwinia tracheiphila]
MKLSDSALPNVKQHNLYSFQELAYQAKSKGKVTYGDLKTCLKNVSVSSEEIFHQEDSRHCTLFRELVNILKQQQSKCFNKKMKLISHVFSVVCQGDKSSDTCEKNANTDLKGLREYGDVNVRVNNYSNRRYNNDRYLSSMNSTFPERYANAQHGNLWRDMRNTRGEMTTLPERRDTASSIESYDTFYEEVYYEQEPVYQEINLDKTSFHEGSRNRSEPVYAVVNKKKTSQKDTIKVMDCLVKLESNIKNLSAVELSIKNKIVMKKLNEIINDVKKTINAPAAKNINMEEFLGKVDKIVVQPDASFSVNADLENAIKYMKDSLVYINTVLNKKTQISVVTQTC